MTETATLVDNVTPTSIGVPMKVIDALTYCYEGEVRFRVGLVTVNKDPRRRIYGYEYRGGKEIADLMNRLEANRLEHVDGKRVIGFFDNEGEVCDLAKDLDVGGCSEQHEPRRDYVDIGVMFIRD